jgi:hydrogenase maturation factor
VIGGHCRADDPHCITCSDEGTVMRVMRARDGMALCVDDAGRRHQIVIDLVEPVPTGGRVLVHAGVAIGRLEVTHA